MVILTEGSQFRALYFARVKAASKTPLMVDPRNIYWPAQMAECGFRYIVWDVIETEYLFRLQDALWAS